MYVFVGEFFNTSSSVCVFSSPWILKACSYSCSHDLNIGVYMYRHFFKCLVTRQVFTTSSCIYRSQYHKLPILRFGNGNCVKNHSFIHSYLLCMNVVHLKHV
jgi:hypothetical protein